MNEHTCGHIGPTGNPWWHCRVCQYKGCKACEVEALERRAATGREVSGNKMPGQPSRGTPTPYECTRQNPCGNCAVCWD